MYVHAWYSVPSLGQPVTVMKLRGEPEGDTSASVALSLKGTGAPESMSR